MSSTHEIATSARATNSRWVAARAAKRRATRERIHARVVHPIDTPYRVRDPLERRQSRLFSTLASVRLLIGAVIIHGLTITGLALVNQLLGDGPAYRPPERLQVSIVETPPPREEPPEVEEPPVVEGIVEPEFERQPEPKADKLPPKLPPNVPQVATPAPETAQPEPERRRIVGLSLESTVQGDGPSFATGTTRMGRTEKVAAAPAEAIKPPSAGSVGGPVQVAKPKSSSVQRAASRIPTRDTHFEKPKRARPSKPGYPPTLEAQGIEGTVTVSVDIAANGKVTAVRIVTSSGQPAFDQAARNAALAETFLPARRDGQPVAFTLTYSYRFRIED